MDGRLAFGRPAQPLGTTLPNRAAPMRYDGGTLEGARMGRFLLGIVIGKGLQRIGVIALGAIVDLIEELLRRDQPRAVGQQDRIYSAVPSAYHDVSS